MTLAETAGKTHVFLKLNDYYALYLHPISPFIMQGRLIVPLREIGRLMGLEVNVEPLAKRATVQGWGRTLVVSADEGTARLNGKVLSLPSPPIWLNQYEDMLIPLRALTNTFGFTIGWNAEARVVSVRDERLLRDPNITIVFDERLPSGRAAEMIPQKFALIRTKRSASCEFHGVTALLSARIAKDDHENLGTFYFFARDDQGHNHIGGPGTYISDVPANSAKDLCSIVGIQVTCRVPLGNFHFRYLLAIVRPVR